MGLMVAMCIECNVDLDKSQKTLHHQEESLAQGIWNQMVQEAKIELKARLKAEQKE